MPTDFRPEQRFAADLDAADPLSHFRDRFYLPSDVIYMDGNSLGVLCKDAETSLLRVLDEWKHLAIRGWMHAEPPWFFMAERLAQQQAPLVGAYPDEIIVTGSTTINLHNLLATFFNPQGRRSKIMMDALNFPTDRYAVESHLRLRGFDPEENLLVVDSRDGHTLDEVDIVAGMDDTVALAVLPSVLYRSGQLLDMPALTQAARERGILSCWDCSHSVGVLPHELHAWDVDCAFWCNYKYLNAGPGATAGLFIHRRHLHRKPGMAGWWGYRKDRQFDMSPEFVPTGDAGGWQTGSLPVLSTAPLEGALQLTLEAGIAAIRQKSMLQTEYLIQLLDDLHSRISLRGGRRDGGFSVVSPRSAARRGGHVAVGFEQRATQVHTALEDAGVIPDFRPPNLIRLAPSPLYTSFTEIWEVVHRLDKVLADQGSVPKMSM